MLSNLSDIFLRSEVQTKIFWLQSSFFQIWSALLGVYIQFYNATLSFTNNKTNF